MGSDEELNPPVTVLSARDVLKDSAGLWAGHLSLFLPLGLVFVSLEFLPFLMQQWPSLSHIDLRVPWNFAAVVGFSLLSGVLFLWCDAAIVFAAARTDRGANPPILECLIAVRGRLVRFLLVRSLRVLMMLLGLVFLIVPGVYVGVILYLAHVSAVLEGSDWIRAMTRSCRLVRKAFWPLFRLSFLLLATSSVAGFCWYHLKDFFFPLGIILDAVFDLFWFPFLLIVATLAFRRLDPTVDFRAEPVDERAGCIVGLLVALVLCAVLIPVFWNLVLGLTAPPGG